MTPAFHKGTEVRVLHPDNTIQQELVIHGKRADAAYQALRQFFTGR